MSLRPKLYNFFKGIQYMNSLERIYIPVFILQVFPEHNL